MVASHETVDDITTAVVLRRDIDRETRAAPIEARFDD